MLKLRKGKNLGNVGFAFGATSDSHTHKRGVLLACSQPLEEGSLFLSRENVNFVQGVGSLLNFAPVSDNFDLYLKEQDTVIDEASLLNDWRSVGNDLCNITFTYGRTIQHPE